VAERRLRVLEIGSGNAPDARSHVLVDRHPWDSRERARGEALRRDGRPLVAADGAALPFAAQSFDLVLALGVLEHTDDPAAFLLEMARVGRRGLVHVPTTFTERIFFREFHTHTFALDGATLVIRRKRFGDAFGGLFDYLAHFDADFSRFVEKNRGLFNLEYAWQGRPSFRVEDYDPARPTFAVFQTRYQGRPFEVRLPVSELLPANVAALLAKTPPRTWRQRLGGPVRALLASRRPGRP
jgi:SAM-dependent methyltransferase